MALHVVIQKFTGTSRGRTVRFIPGQIIDDLQYDFGQLSPDGLNTVELSPAIATAVEAFNEQYGVKDPVQPLLGALVSAGLIPVAPPGKGALLVGDGSKWLALPVGADGEVVTASSAATQGVAWLPTAASTLRQFQRPLTPTANPVVFTSATKFAHGGTDTECVLYNGVRLVEGAGNDYVASESGGAGTGYDTVTFQFTPETASSLTIDLNPSP